MTRPIISHIRHAFVALLAATSAAIGFTACDDNDFFATDADQKLVVEGWIDIDGYPTVIVTLASTPSAEPVSIVESIVRWGKVTISDGTKEITMIGGPDHNVYPPYAYREFEDEGIVGKTYTITAEYKGLKAKASSTMLPPATIDDIIIKPIEGNDTLRSVTVKFSQTFNEPAYYVAFTKVLDEDTRMYPAAFGTMVADNGPGQYELALFRGKNRLIEDHFVPNFEIGQTVELVFARVERAAYEYYRAYNEMVMFGNSIFMSPTVKLESNIEGGFGYWCARGGRLMRFSVD